MFEKNIIIKNKRKPLQIEIPNKIITSYVSNKLGINISYKKFNTNLCSQSNLRKSSEDDYDSFVYKHYNICVEEKKMVKCPLCGDCQIKYKTLME